MRCLQLCSHVVLIITAACVNSLGVYLALRGAYIANNSNINIRNIGQSSDSPNGALQCITDRVICCLSQNPRLGEWYLPNGELVHGTILQSQYFIEAEEIMERCS